MSPQQRLKSHCIMEEERPRRILQRSYSARLPSQNTPFHQHSSRIYQDKDCYLQFQPDGTTRSFATASHAMSFDEGLAANLSSGEKDGSFRFDPSFEERRELPPRAPRKYISHFPSQQFCHSTAPRYPESGRGLMPAPGPHRPMLERRNSGYISRNHHHIRGDRSGSFPREDDRPPLSKQFLRQPSLSAIAPDPRGYSSSRSLLNVRQKKSSKRSASRRRYAELEENSTDLRQRSDPKQFHPQRSTSIYRKFDKKNVSKQDDDIWVERLILNGPNGVKKTCFKSLRGNITRSEPPTGAKTIVYLEDIIVDKKGRPSRTRPIQTESQPEPEVQAQKARPQPEQNLSPEFQNEESQNISDKAETDKRKKFPKGQLKRRAGLFGFMKKNGKNKNGYVAKE